MTSTIDLPDASHHSMRFDVGNTKAQHVPLSPDLPIASTTLLLTALNLTSPLTALGFLFALAAFGLSLLNVLILSRAPIRVSRPTTILLLTFACLSLMISRTVALGDEARVHVSLAQEHSSRFQVAGSVGQIASFPSTAPRMLKSNDTALPVDALKAVERSQQALPNAGDVDTEAHENSIDETRFADESAAMDDSDRGTEPPNLNGVFIVNTHTGESWYDIHTP